MILEKTEITKYTFSGHDSFHCRQLWLKKGFDFVQEGHSFNSEDAVVKLGVGKNMVSAIRYWLKAYNIIDNKDTPTKFGTKLFDTEDGYDPFLEDDASLWLLHYQLVKTGLAPLIEAGNKILEVNDVTALLNKYLGVPLSGRAFRSNLLFVPHKRISTAIPNA